MSSRRNKSASSAADEPRSVRRKRQTRSRLLLAALKLMAEKGVEAVPINEITEAADVGFGTFYNYFESKEAVYVALLDGVFRDFAEAVESLLGSASDPAEVIAVSVRYTIERALREPVWGQFLVRGGFSARSVDHGLGQRLLRDVRNGIAVKRLTVPDPLMSFLSVGGTMFGAISIGLQLGPLQGQQSAVLKALGSDLKHLPERAAQVALEALGIGRAEAERIAYRPLPATPWKTSGVEYSGDRAPTTLREAPASARGKKRTTRTSSARR